MFRIAVLAYLIFGCVLGGLLSIVRGIYFWAGREQGPAGLYTKLAKLSLGKGLLELPIFVGLLWSFLNNEAWAWDHWNWIMWIVVPLAIPVYVYRYWEKRIYREYELAGTEQHPPTDS